MKKISLIILLFLPLFTMAQDPLRFEEEIQKFKDNSNTYDIVFTGSSSVRMWESLQSDFPDANLINTGFGGSHMSDLSHYLEVLVLKFKPSLVFIYEGDNDINSGKKPDVVIKETREVLDRIFASSENIRIVLISAKPSPSRFKFKEEYAALNEQFKALALENDQIRYVDVWEPMLNNEGEPIADIFIEDQLHMNAKGYAIWAEVIGPFLD